MSQAKPKEVVAQLSGICPVCDRFISKNVSKVRRLPKGLEPVTDDLRSNKKTGRTYYADGRFITPTARHWVHSRCFEEGIEWLNRGWRAPSIAEAEEVSGKVYRLRGRRR